jgi:hypothetical protein
VKKAWTGTPWQRQNERHAQASLAQRLQWKRWKVEERREREGIEAVRQLGHRAPFIFKAPSVLSLVEAPEVSIQFFHELQSFLKRRDVFVDLSQVTRITPDAIALLLSIVKKIGQHQVHVSGNYPQNMAAMATIRESGFDQYLRSSLPHTNTPRGAIMQRDFLFGARQAEGRFAQKLVDFATKRSGVSGVSLKATYGHLLDCMTNTHEHAGSTAGVERWWAFGLAPIFDTSS